MNIRRSEDILLGDFTPIHYFPKPKIFAKQQPKLSLGEKKPFSLFQAPLQAGFVLLSSLVLSRSG